MAVIGAFFYNTKKWHDSLNLSSEDSIQSAYKRQKEKIISSLPKKQQIKDREYLEHTLQSLINDKNVNIEANKAQLAFQKNVKDIFTKLTNYNYSSLDAAGQRRVYQQGIRTSHTQVNEAKKLINQLYNILAQLTRSSSISKQKITEYKTALNDLKQFVIQQQSQGSAAISMSSLDQPTRGILNELLKTASVSRADAQGQLFEIILAAASEHISHEKNTNTKKIMSNLKGKERSSIVIDMTNIDEELQKQLFANKTLQIDEYNKVKLSSPSQDKLDVVFEWEGENLQVSAKSYSDLQRIHIASKFRLWHYILNDDGAFVNHWISLLASTGQQKHKVAYQNLMKYGLLVKSMVGTMKSAGQADAFIVQDITTGKIYIRTMYELLHPLAEKLEYIDSIVHYTNYPNHLPKVSDIHTAFAHLTPITMTVELKFQNLLQTIF